MARNKFEVEFLKIEHIFAIPQREGDLEILKQMKSYIEQSGKKVVDAEVYSEGKNKVYLFKLQTITVNQANDLLSEMFEGGQWKICQITYNPITGLYVAATL